MTSMNETVGLGADSAVGMVINAVTNDSVGAPRFVYDFVCFDAQGNEKWRESIHNLVTTGGKNDMLNQYFKGSAYTAAWFMGLKGTGSASSTDTLASHSGWTEVTPYSGNRPTIAFGTTSAGSNTATQLSITINATATVAGAFIASVNTGTGGILYSAADFAASRGVASGDVMQITPTVSVS